MSHFFLFCSVVHANLFFTRLRSRPTFHLQSGGTCGIIALEVKGVVGMRPGGCLAAGAFVFLGGRGTMKEALTGASAIRNRANSRSINHLNFSNRRLLRPAPSRGCNKTAEPGRIAAPPAGGPDPQRPNALAPPPMIFLIGIPLLEPPLTPIESAAASILIGTKRTSSKSPFSVPIKNRIPSPALSASAPAARPSPISMPKLTQPASPPILVFSRHHLQGDTSWKIPSS